MAKLEPFVYPDSYIKFLGFLKVGFKTHYRMVQGVARGPSEYVKYIQEMHIHLDKTTHVKD